MTKHTIISLAVACGILFGALPEVAHAQEVQITGPLAGQPSVRHMRVYREGRVQLAPFANFTLQDEFSRTIGFGATLSYHLTDWFGIGAWGFFAPIHIDTALTDQVVQTGQTTDRNALSLPQRGLFNQQIGNIDWAAALQLTFIPLRGKLSLFQKIFLDADLYISLGFGFVGVSERADVTSESGFCATAPSPTAPANDDCVATQTARASRVAPAPTFAVGLSIYANEYMALNLEWRAMPFAWNTSGTDEGGRNELGVADNSGAFPDHAISSADRAFHLNHMFIIGWSFYLPSHARISE